MRKYKIDQEDLIAKGEVKVDQFSILFKDVPVTPMDSEFGDVYAALASYAVYHTDCQAVWSGYKMVNDVYMRVLQFIGYEEDIRYAEMLFTSARLVFADRMEPKPEPTLSDMENVYRMRSAGMERIRIARLMGWAKGGAKVTRLYKAACEARGEDPTLTGQGTNVRDFRKAYAEGFQTEFWTRLANARDAADAEISPGLVLADRKERVKEAMYDRYPSLRPDPSRTPTVRKTSKANRWTAKDQREWEKRNSAASQAGRQAGRKAASEVEIKGTTPKRRLEGE